jgi:CRISPR/Cas system CSM-associated protein Csm3 (group 7 of RAMP superfamily)
MSKKKVHFSGKGGQQFGRKPRRDDSRNQQQWNEAEFINPYNFVPFEAPAPPKTPPPSHEKFAGLSGKITCGIEVITPLAIPDSEKTEGDPRVPDHKVKPFLTVDDKPYIPGSSIKGALRSVMEAVTNSCMSVLTSNLAVFRDNRSHTITDRIVGKMTGKILPNRETRADRFDPPDTKIEFTRKGIFNQYTRKPGKPFFRSADYPKATGKEKIPSEIADLYHQMTGDTNFTFEDKEKPQEGAKRPEQMTPEWMRHYILPWLRNYRYHPINPKDPEGWHNPHWFFRTKQLDGKDYVIQFGRNFRFKWAFNPRKAIPRDFHPCTDPKNLCPVCALFGMASETPTEAGTGRQQAKVDAFAGRVAFGPATCIASGEIKRIDSLKILNTPKPSCRSFYLHPRDRNNENVEKEEEYVELKDGKIRTTRARGRKFYWHHTTRWRAGMSGWKDYFQKLAVNGQRKLTPLNSTVDAIMPGTMFEFTIEFENLRGWELGMLLWTLTLPEQGNLAHHLGGGKPLGLGSVKMTAKKLTFIDRVARYQQLFALGADKNFGDGTTAIDFSKPENQELAGYLNAFRQKVETWNKTNETAVMFRDLPYVKDLLNILSLEQPQAAATKDAIISYPPGVPGGAKGKEEELQINEKELHYTWFGHYKWGQRLFRVDEICDSEPKTQRYQKK